MKILIVDDEEGIRSIIKEYCEEEGYEVEEAETGKKALEKLKIKDYDMLILDIMMPEMDGYSMLKECPISRRVPTIVLSARGEEYDKLSGFDLGIDDYVTKPFSPKELMARIKAISNRLNHTITDIYTYNNLEVNFLSHTLKINNKIVEITPKEFEILTYLIQYLEDLH